MGLLPSVQQGTHLPSVQQWTYLPSVQQLTHLSNVQQWTNLPRVQQWTHLPSVQQLTHLSNVHQWTHLPSVQQWTHLPSVQQHSSAKCATADLPAKCTTALTCPEYDSSRLACQVYNCALTCPGYSSGWRVCSDYSWLHHSSPYPPSAAVSAEPQQPHDHRSRCSPATVPHFPCVRDFHHCTNESPQCQNQKWNKQKQQQNPTHFSKRTVSLSLGNLSVSAMTRKKWRTSLWWFHGAITVPVEIYIPVYPFFIKSTNVRTCHLQTDVCQRIESKKIISTHKNR